MMKLWPLGVGRGLASLVRVVFKSKYFQQAEPPFYIEWLFICVL